jgi:16S rRNA C967 or C1407 C5-methylase (RsmB/RsmF family)
MRARLGPEWEAFQEALAKPPRTTIRLHPEKGKNLYPEASPVSWHPRGRVLAERPNFALEPAWHAGAYYVQEASSMSVRVFLPERRPLRVIDLSAAPGGKSTLLLDELGLTGGLLIANDPDSHRRAALAENLARWAIPAYLITGRDPAWWAEHYPSAFDVVLLDAPCSGEGLWRKTPSLSQTWRPEEVHFCSRRQRRLLSAAKTLVAPGGHLIYSTCTFAPEENEDNLSAFFAKTRNGFPFAGRTIPPRSWKSPTLAAAGGITFIRTAPSARGSSSLPGKKSPPPLGERPPNTKPLLRCVR